MTESIDKDKISIVVPVYNVEGYVEQCISSIVGQSCGNLEIILVDDGSTDRSGAICDAWAGRDGRIRVIHRPNGGMSAARNSALDICTGDYIAFVDGDDFVEPDYIESLYGEIKRRDADMAVCSFDLVDAAGGLVRTERMTEMAGPADGKYILSEVMPDYKYVVLWNKLYTRRLFDGLRFPIGKIHEDEFLTHRLLWQCRRVTTVPDVLYHYVQRPGSIMHSPLSKQRVLSFIEMHRDRMSFYREKEAQALYHKAMQEYCNYLVEISAQPNRVVDRTMRRSFQREMRVSVRYLRGQGISERPRRKLQNTLGCVSLRLTARLKGIYHLMFRRGE